MTCESITSEEITLNVGATLWKNTNIPSSWKNPILVGYYINGTGASTINFYAYYETKNRDKITIACKNNGSSTATFAVEFFIIHT